MSQKGASSKTPTARSTTKVTGAIINKRIGKKSRDRVLTLVKRKGVIRPRDLEPLGINRMVLVRLTEEGVLERVGWGLYKLSEADPLGAPDLVLVSARVHQAVIGLVSALDHHGLTTEIPRVVDVLLPRGMSAPRLNHPPLRVFWASGPSYSEGIEKVRLDGVSTRVTTPAKTVADCFKFRSRVGLEVALEALKTGLSQNIFTSAQFARHAKTDRVLTLTRPYLDCLA